MNRRRFIQVSGLGALVALFAQTSSAVASTFESCVAVLQQIRDIATGPGDPLDKLADIVALIDGEIGPPPSNNPTLSGDFAGTIPAGEVWEIVGDVNLTGDLIVEGTLSNAVDTFTLEGNGHQILVQNAGTLNLVGLPKVAWIEWGENANGWEAGDELAVAPTDKFSVSRITWGGSWNDTARPTNAADVPLPDGTIARPEVANLSQSARIRNVSRVMFHSAAGVQLLRNLAVVNAGVFDTLDFYPIHFHKCGDTVRGSLLEDVVVVDSLNRGFVPHGSNGVSFTRCVAVEGQRDSFWWNTGSDDDLSFDISWDSCAVIGQRTTGQGAGANDSGFTLRGGTGHRAVGCRAAGVKGTQHVSGFSWPENGTGAWLFQDCVSHNNGGVGAFHKAVNGDVDGFKTYRNNYSGWYPGVYSADHTIRRLVAFDNNQRGITSQADIRHKSVSKTSFDRQYAYVQAIADSMIIQAAQANGEGFVDYQGTLSSVVVDGEPSHTGNPERGRLAFRFIDTGLTPSDFIVINDGGPLSVFSILENGTEIYRYENGAWL